MLSKKRPNLQCEFCDKVYLSRSGLEKHVAKKHPSFKTQETSCSDCLRSNLVPTTKNKVEPLIFERFP